MAEYIDKKQALNALETLRGVLGDAGTDAAKKLISGLDDPLAPAANGGGLTMAEWVDKAQVESILNELVENITQRSKGQMVGTEEYHQNMGQLIALSDAATRVAGLTPATNVAEVCCCAGCKHERHTDDIPGIWCTVDPEPRRVQAEWFCSRGERSERLKKLLAELTGDKEE